MAKSLRPPGNYPGRRIRRNVVVGLAAATLSTAAWSLTAPPAQASPDRPLCAFAVSASAGGDDLRGDSRIEFDLVIRQGVFDHIIPLHTNGARELPGGINAGGYKTYYVAPDGGTVNQGRCVMKSQVAGVVVSVDGSRGAWPLSYDNWDLRRVVIIDAREVVWDSGHQMLRLTESQRRAWLQPGHNVTY